MQIANYHPIQADEGYARQQQTGLARLRRDDTEGAIAGVALTAPTKALSPMASAQDRQESLQGVIAPPLNRPVRSPRLAQPSYRFELLQQWECVVRSIDDDEFTAMLYDLTDPTQAAEEATFLLRDVPDDDVALVEEGAVFYWSIGYRTNRAGEKIRIAQVRFRRLPPLSKSELREVEDDVSVLRSLLVQSKPPAE